MTPSPYDALQLENQLCFPLYVCAKEVVRRYRPCLSALGLTYTQYIVMLVLWERKQISCRDLSQLLWLDSGTLTPVLKSLEKKGFLRRSRSRKDERILVLEVTSSGDALREQALSVPEQMASCVPLSPKDAAELYQLLYRLLEAFQRSEETAR